MKVERKIGKIAILFFLTLFWISLVCVPTLVYAQQEKLHFAAKQGESSWKIVPLASSEAATDFYNYNNDQSNTGLEISDQSILFLYRDTNTNAIYLVIIHDKPGDGSGGSADLSLDGLPEFSQLVLRDDPDADDTYDFDPPSAQIHWEWMPIHNDGVVIGELGEDMEITITLDSLEGIDGWSILSGSGDINNPDQISLPSLSEPLTITAKIGDPPTSCFQVGAEEPIMNEPVAFDASCSNDPDGEIAEYNWDFGDGTTGQGREVSHRFSSAGTYTVSLTVVDNDGLESEATKEVKVTEAAAVATRSISTIVALPESTFRVDVAIEAKRDLDGLGLDEDLPVGWTVTPIDNGGATFKKSETQWIFAGKINRGETRYIVYEVTVPPTLTSIPDQFLIQGEIDSASPAFISKVGGDQKVKIQACLPVIVAMSHLKTRPRQVEEGAAEEIVDLRLSNNVTTEQVKIARRYWVNEERVPKTCGVMVALEDLKKLAAHNLTGQSIDKPLPNQNLKESPQIASRAILTPIPPNIIYLQIDDEEALKARIRIEIWADRNLNGLGVDEDIPQNWKVESIQSSGAAFKHSTVQWAFTGKIKAGEIRTIIYEVTVPKDAESNFCNDRVIREFMGYVQSASPGFKSYIGGDKEVELTCCLTIPLAIAKLDTENNVIDPLLSNKISFDQIQAALAFWLEDTEVPGTCGLGIEFEMMKQLVSYWLNGVSVTDGCPQDC